MAVKQDRQPSFCLITHPHIFPQHLKMCAGEMTHLHFLFFFFGHVPRYTVKRGLCISTLLLVRSLPFNFFHNNSPNISQKAVILDYYTSRWDVLCTNLKDIALCPCPLHSSIVYADHKKSTFFFITPLCNLILTSPPARLHAPGCVVQIHFYVPCNI